MLSLVIIEVDPVYELIALNCDLYPSYPGTVVGGVPPPGIKA